MIQEILSPLRPDLSAEQLAQFETYYAMLADWNERMNLTAISGPDRPETTEVKVPKSSIA